MKENETYFHPTTGLIAPISKAFLPHSGSNQARYIRKSFQSCLQRAARRAAQLPVNFVQAPLNQKDKGVTGSYGVDEIARAVALQQRNVCSCNGTAHLHFIKRGAFLSLRTGLGYIL